MGIIIIIIIKINYSIIIIIKAKQMRYFRNLFLIKFFKGLGM